MKMFYYTYKITLLKGSLAGHYYYGQHRTTKLTDNYAGSGRIVKNYFKHYDKIEGITYVKEIIHFYNDEDELNIAEKVLIGDKYETDKLCLNLLPGGTNICRGGNKKGKTSNRKGVHLSEETKEKIRQANLGKKLSEETKRKCSEANKNKVFSEETRKKISEALKGHKVSDEKRKKLSKNCVGNKGMHWKKDPETGKRIYYKNN